MDEFQFTCLRCSAPVDYPKDTFCNECSLRIKKSSASMKHPEYAHDIIDTKTITDGVQMTDDKTY
jgi:DNA-directed RNA polymerase subunit RPC12/RpoP